MLHGYKKSRHNIYDNLEFLGLNLYEQKHFCFGEEGSDDPGGDYDADIDRAVAEAKADQETEDYAKQLAEAYSQYGFLDPLDPEEDPDFGFDPFGYTTKKYRPYFFRTDMIKQPKGLGDFADRAGLPDVPMGPMANIDAYHQGYYDPVTGKTISDKQYGINILNELNQKGMAATVQNMLNARAFRGLGIPEMNALEKQGYKTFGLGYRGPFESRTPQGVTRETYGYDRNYGGTNWGQNITFFRQFAEKNPNLTTVEAMAQYNATANTPEEQVSIQDVQSMGFDFNAPVGPQVAFANTESERGLAQALGLIAQTIATGSPMGALSTVMMSGSGEGYGKGVLGHMADMFEGATGLSLPEAPDIGIPSFAEIASDLFGPEQSTMDPASFGITSVTEESIGPEAFGLADLSPPTNEEVGFTESFGVDDSYQFSKQFRERQPIIQPQLPETAVAVEETPAIPFNLGRETTPPSRVNRIANIYGIDEDAAKKMLGIA